MLEKLKHVQERYAELEERMMQPEVYSDPAQYGRLARERTELAPLAEACGRCAAAEKAMAEARELMDDEELRALAREEYDRASRELEQAEREVKLLLLPRDPNDGKSVVMEIRAGTGGEEAALFAYDLYRMYSLYAARRGWSLETASVSDTELGGIKEIVFTVEGPDVWSRLKFESGGHCVKRVPVTESNGRTQTSLATVAVLPEAEETELFIDPKDLKIDTFRSTGAGGQKVNKTETAIRVTHLPTGTVVECQDERSQYKNKDRALKILRSRLYEAQQAKAQSEMAAERRSQVGTGERSDKIRTYFFSRRQVVDHRLSGDEKSYGLDGVLRGELDELIDALTAADQARRLSLHTAREQGGSNGA